MSGGADTAVHSDEESEKSLKKMKKALDKEAELW